MICRYCGEEMEKMEREDCGVGEDGIYREWVERWYVCLNCGNETDVEYEVKYAERSIEV